MRKLRLEIESLHVDSFATLGDTRAARGTVLGRETETETTDTTTEPIDLPTTQQTWPNNTTYPNPLPTSDNEEPSNYTCWSCDGTCFRWVCTDGPQTH